MSFNVGQAVGYLDLDTSGFNRGFKSALQDLKIFQDQSASAMDKVGAVGSAMTNVGSSMTKYVTTPLLGAGTAVVAVSAKFESAMSNVAAISGATGDDLQRLTDKAQEMGATTKFSASESAEALKYMAMAGWDTEAMLNGIGGVMNLAAASGEDLATTSDIVTDAMTAFGLSADQSARFADVLAMTANRSNTSVALMGETFKYVAPVAGALGYSIEDASVAIGLMANSGIKGSQAGTSLKNMLTNLAKPTDQVKSYMDELGISMTDASGVVKPLNQLLLEMRNSFSQLTDAEKAEYAAGIAGKEGMSGLLAVVNSSETDFNNLTTAINNSSGAAEQVAGVMMDNLGGQLTIMKSTLEGIAISFGNILLPFVKDVVQWLQNLLTKINNLSESQKEAIVRIAGIVAAIGPVLLIGGKLLTGISKLSGAFKAAKTAFTGIQAAAAAAGTSIGTIAAPVLAVVAVIATLVAAFKHLWETNDEFKTNVLKIWDDVKGAFEKLSSGIVDRLNSIGFDFQNITEVLKSVWNGFCSFLAPVFEGVFKQVSNIFNFITDQILNALDFWISVFKGDWEGAWDSIKNTFSNVWNLIVNTFKNIGNTLKGLFDAILGWFGTSWEKTWTSIKDFFVRVWNSIIDTFKTLPSKLSSVGKNLVEGLWNGITSAGSWLLNKITGFANGIIERFKKTFGIASPAKSTRILGRFLPQGLALGVEDTTEEAVDSVEDMSNSVLARAERMVRQVGGLFQGTNGIFSSGILQTDYLRRSLYAGGSSGSGVTAQGSVQKYPSGTSGNVYNFYSPKAIDPVQASSLMRKTAQELALEV